MSAVEPPAGEPEGIGSSPPPAPGPEGVMRPGKRGLQERPEKNFERRRRALLLGLALFVVLGGLMICNRCQQPVDVAPMFSAGSSAKNSSGLLPAPVAGAGEASVTPLRVAFPAPGPTSAPAVPTPVIVNGAITCYAAKDIPLPSAGGVVPSGAMARVTGYTAAKGGLAQVGSDWVPVGWLDCQGDLTYLERPFMIEATPTRARSGSQSSSFPMTDQGGVIVVTPTSPPASPTPVNGMWWVAPNCWVVNTQGVSQIWVDGKGVSTGTYCGVHDLHIVMGGQ